MTNEKRQFGHSEEEKFHHKEHRERENRAVRGLTSFLRPLVVAIQSQQNPWLLVFVPFVSLW
jgi:hypothetical protein